jgi:hypothetical protein
MFTPVCENPAAVTITNVLLVRVSVVFLPTRVSVAAGTVRVPDAVAEAWIVVEPEVAPCKFTGIS